MHRSGFEKVCDVVAYLQTSLGETTQWVVTALCIGLAGTMLVGALMTT